MDELHSDLRRFHIFSRAEILTESQQRQKLIEGGYLLT